MLAGCAAGRHPAALPPADPGASEFQAYCAGCHVSKGPGTMTEAPPLEGSPWVTGPEDRLIRIVLHGLRGPVEIGGQTYNQEMPAVGQVLTDTQLASLATFVRRRFGASAQAVDSTGVARVRARYREHSGYWTVEELLKQP